MWTKVGSDNNEVGDSGDLLADDRSGRFSVSGAALRIERVEVEDRGVYVCTMMSADGSGAMVARASAIVEVGRKKGLREYTKLQLFGITFPICSMLEP